MTGVKRALVIGGTGFIGLNLVDALLERGIGVRVTRRRRSITVFVQKRPVELVDASLDEPVALRKAMAGCDVVFLTAGHYPRYSLDLETSVTEGTRGVKNACRAAIDAGVPRLVYTSSIAALGPAPAGRAADERDVPASMPTDSVYRAVKWAMEREIDGAVAEGLDAVTLLPGGCVGPWDVRAGTGGFLVGLVQGLIPWWIEGLVHVVDVGDVARVHIAAAERGDRGSRYCLSGHTIGVGELFRTIVERYGGRMPAERLGPEAARARADAEEREAAPRRQRVPFPRETVDVVACGQPVSSALAGRTLGFSPTRLSDALDRAYQWFVQYRYLAAPAASPRRSHVRESF